jgi:hypothetical protein
MDTTTWPRAFFHTEVASMLEADSATIVYRYDLYVDQRAMVAPRVGAYARLWETSGLGFIGVRVAPGFRDHLREVVLQSLEAFLNDYLAANPQR